MSVSPSMPVVVRPADARTRSPLARATVAEPCVRVDPATAFQLARFADDERVRDAAAESLWPREYVDRCDIEASDGDFATVPFAERVVALLVASSLCLHPNRAKSLGVVPLYDFLSPPRHRDAPVRRFRIGARPRVERAVLPTGREQAWSRAAVFRLPGSLFETVTQVSRWGGINRRLYHGECAWQVDERSIGLSIPRLIRSRAKTASGGVQLVDHEGCIVPGFDSVARAIVHDGRVEIDPSLLLRLESGGLAGAFLSFANSVPSFRHRYPPDAILSLEIGPSLDAPVVMRTLTGRLEPRFDVTAVVGRDMRSIPAFGGETVRSLAVIAEMVGVWQGGCVRASFEHHPLHPRHFASVDDRADPSTDFADGRPGREVA
jgi:hypothetical protein